MTEDNCKKKECMITGENARRSTALNNNKSVLPLPFLLFLQLNCNAAAIYISNKESFLVFIMYFIKLRHLFLSLVCKTLNRKDNCRTCRMTLMF